MQMDDSKLELQLRTARVSELEKQILALRNSAAESEQLITKLRFDNRETSQRKSSEVRCICYCGTIWTNRLEIWNMIFTLLVILSSFYIRS